MIRIYPDQLAAQLKKELSMCYLLSGNELLMLQESQDLIRKSGMQQFSEYHNISVNSHTDWDTVFSICTTMSLFSKRKTLLLMLPENSITLTVGDQLIKLYKILHNDILLILRASHLTKIEEKSAWFKAFTPKTIYVNCQSPKQNQLTVWVSARAKLMNLVLENAANQLLCYCYEGNLVALSQTLERLSLIYPDGKLTLPRVEEAVSDSAHFTSLHWLNALLEGKIQRAWHILKQMRRQDVELAILLRTLQRELLMLMTLKRGMESIPLRTLFDQYKVWQNRRNLMTQAICRISYKQLHQAIKELANIELSFKQDCSGSVWIELEALSMFICGKSPIASFMYE